MISPIGFAGVTGPGPGGLILKTVAEMQALQLAGTILPGRFYLITDAPGNSQIIVQGFSVNEIGEGIRRMLCPADYKVEVDGSGNDWIGIWNSGKTVAAGQLAIWGGWVWQNTTGNIGSADDLTTLNATDWTEISKVSFANGEYVPMIFGCHYDLVNNWVSRQWDGSGNIFGVDWLTDTTAYGFAFNSGGGIYIRDTNMIDVSDWNYATSGFRFTNNTCLCVINNSNGAGIYFNSNDGLLHTNSNNGEIRYNDNLGDIRLNTNNGSIEFNTNTGGIFLNSNNGSIFFNANLHNIEQNSNGGHIQQNSNQGPIIANSNTGVIGNNTNRGNIASNASPVVNIIFNSNSNEIFLNSNAGDINSNDNNGTIDNNSNNGSIFGNHNTGGINSNSHNGWVAVNENNGEIGGNSNGGTIEFNMNNGPISFNSNTGRIYFNQNNGDISNIGAANSTIQFNVNNGRITTTTAGSINDPQVNK